MSHPPANDIVEVSLFGGCGGGGNDADIEENAGEEDTTEEDVQEEVPAWYAFWSTQTALSMRLHS